MLDYDTLPAVTEAEFVKDPDAYLEKVSQGESPYLIIRNSGSRLLLFDWEDYWRRFGTLYPDGERERIEEACRQAAQENEAETGHDRNEKQ